MRFAMGTIETSAAGLAAVAPSDDVAEIVHDLRDPLAALTVEAYVLDRKLAHGDYTDVRYSVSRIISNLEFLDRMVEDLLDSSRLGEGPLELHRSSIELGGLLLQVIERVVPVGHRQRVILEAPIPITMPIDSLRIERVVANLIGNALRYSQGDGPVVVRLEAGALAARISVIDAGPGIPPEEQAQIFEKHRRGSSARGIAGHGLGLYLSKAIVEAHGGQMGVYSTPGLGSQFYFELPATSMTTSMAASRGS
jgi:signal transduction histidine kinase